MNTKFFVSGLIISKLMSIKKISALEFAPKVGKTRTAIYLILQRPIIKDVDAEKLIEALGFSMEEVLQMDKQGLFNGIRQVQENSSSSINKPENEYLKLKLENIEASFIQENAYLREQTKLKDEDLRRKDMIIQDLVCQLGKKRNPVTNENPDAETRNIAQINKIDDYILPNIFSRTGYVSQSYK